METLAWPVKVKKCSCCGLEKELINFYPHKNTKDKLRAKCKQCTTTENKEWVENNKDKKKNSHYRRTYGISYSEVIHRHSVVNNKCEVCAEEKELLAVDHCHTTGKVRGLLCMRCNLLLGKIEENKDIIFKLFNYLKERS